MIKKVKFYRDAGAGIILFISILKGKYYYAAALSALFVLLVITSCNTPQKRGIASVEYKIPENFNFTADDIKKNLSFYKEENSGYKLVIVFYSYYPVVEVMSFSGDEIITRINPGELKALIRVMDKDKVIKIHFLEVKGEGKEILLREFSEKAALLFLVRD